MCYLVVDDRFPSPVYVFLDADPRLDDRFPGLPVHSVTLQRKPAPDGGQVPDWDGVPSAVGRHVGDPALFREFRSEAAVGLGTYLPVEPWYVGRDWLAYVRQFRPQGLAPRPRSR